MESSQLFNVIDRAVFDGTKTLTIIAEDNERLKHHAEDFLNGFYYRGTVKLLENGIMIIFYK